MQQLRWRAVAVVAVLAATGGLMATRSARLGLDLRGGTQIALEATETDRQTIDGDTMDRTLEVLRRRVDQLGVAEPTLQRSGGTTVITGNFSQKEAKDLALLIRAGALPVPVDIVEQRTIGPTLGKAAIRASVAAALIGAALTILYMVAYYRLLGLSLGPGRRGIPPNRHVPCTGWRRCLMGAEGGGEDPRLRHARTLTRRRVCVAARAPG